MVAKKSHVDIISVITNQGKARFMMYRDVMNSELLIKFMTCLTKDGGHYLQEVIKFTLPREFFGRKDD